MMLNRFLLPSLAGLLLLGCDAETTSPVDFDTAIDTRADACPPTGDAVPRADAGTTPTADAAPPSDARDTPPEDMAGDPAPATSDAEGEPETDSVPSDTADASEDDTWRDDVPPPRFDPTDPLVMAIAEATSVGSHAGVHVHDYEWDTLASGLNTSRLSPERMREALDQLFLLSPYPSVYPDIRLPPALQIADRDAPGAFDSAATTGETYLAEHIALYAAPGRFRPNLAAILEATPRAIIFLEARLIRVANSDVPYGVELRVGYSECGWCAEGYRYVLGPDGEIESQNYDGRLAAYG